MPSLQSRVFKEITKIISAHMNAISSIPKLRSFMEMGRMKPFLPVGTTFSPDKVNGVAVEWLTPSKVSTDTVILYLHGGGWTLGWKNNHRTLVAFICQAASSHAIAVDYRLAPEHPYPAALEDCLSVYRWLINNSTRPDQIVIVGDSAGANLALTTIMSLRDSNDLLPAAVVCISPMTDLTGSGETFYSQKDALLTPRFALTMASLYYGDHDPQSPLISPLFGDLSGFPRLLIQVGEDEILLSDSIRLADKATMAGVNMKLTVWPGMWHVWHTFVPFLPEAKQAVEQIGKFIRES
jgi:acetyl esterase/lipase